MSAEKPIDHEQALSWLSAYLDGELPSPDKLLLEAHLAKCDSCSAELDALRSIQSLVQGLPEVEPPQDLADRVMRRVASEKSTGGSAVGRIVSLMPFLRKAAAVAAVVLIIQIGVHEWRSAPPKHAASVEYEAPEETAVDADRSSLPDTEMTGAEGMPDRLQKLSSRSGRQAAMAPLDSPVASRAVSIPSMPVRAKKEEAAALGVAAELAVSDEVNSVAVPGRLDRAEAQELAPGNDTAAAEGGPVRLTVHPRNQEGLEAVIAAFRVEGESRLEFEDKATDPSVVTFAFREQSAEPGILKFAVRRLEFARFLQELEVHAVVSHGIEYLAGDAETRALGDRKARDMVIVEITLSAGMAENEEN